MSNGSDSSSRSRSLAAAVVPAAFLLGLAIVAVSAVSLGVLASEGHTTPLSPSYVHASNETAILAYAVPPYAPPHAVLEVAYAFPDAPGDTYLLSCADLERLAAGRPLLNPLVRERDAREGGFTRPMNNYLGFGSTLFTTNASADGAGAGSGASGGSGSGTTTLSSGDGISRQANACAGAFVAFRWDIADPTDPDANRPEASVAVRAVPLDSRDAAALFVAAALGGILALGGGLEWGRRRPSAPSPDLDEGAGALETLYRFAQRSEAWLARARRYVIVSGTLGVFLWYPVLLPWAWRAGREGSSMPWMPWALAGGALLLLAGLTALWAREFLRLDRELTAWRAQLAELRRREDALLAELSE